MPPKPIQRSSDIAAILRERVVLGRYIPGRPLPTRSTLVAELDSSRQTVQTALDRLVVEGFLVSRPRVGTYVVDHPPHSHAYALVVTESRSGPFSLDMTMYPRLLIQTAGTLALDRGRRIKVYEGVDSLTLEESFHQLRSDIFNRRIAGVIAMNPWRVANMYERSPVPWVFVGSHEHTAGYYALHQGMEAWLDAAARHLKRIGRRRVALISNASSSIESVKNWASLVRKQGLSVEPDHLQAAHAPAPAWARQASRLLMSLPSRTRPDAILVTDDMLTEHVLCGLMDRGLRSPEDVEVVGLANFPSSPPNVLPVTRLGWDMRQLLLTGLDLIDQHHAHHTQPSTLQPPLYFEKDIPPVAASLLMESPSRPRTNKPAADRTLLSRRSRPARSKRNES